MKMEIAIKSPCDGVATLKVKQGDRLNAGDIVATVG